jgi:DNA-binding NtrC family response regulator
LEAEGYHVLLAAGGQEARQILDQNDAADEESVGYIALALLDVLMPDLDGLEVLKSRAGAAGDTAIVMLTGLGHSDRVIRATQFGAADYICKPFDLDEMLDVVRHVLDERWQVQHAELYDLPRPDPATHIVGTTREMVRVFRQISQVASQDKTVLITGENGTGKELVARTIHWASARSQKPYVTLNCAAVQDTMIEMELFGCFGGKATGVPKDHVGVFEQADSGTLFLDEIGVMSAAMQKKVLRVLEDKVVRRMGGVRGQEKQVDVRFIAATNADLAAERRQHQFRDDLFQRLHVLPVHLPPLRERKRDIPALVAHFLEKHKPRANGMASGITRQAIEKLMEYEWPGNVRELENAIIRGLTRSRGRLLTAAHIVLTDRGDRIGL